MAKTLADSALAHHSHVTAELTTPEDALGQELVIERDSDYEESSGQRYYALIYAADGNEYTAAYTLAANVAGVARVGSRLPLESTETLEFAATAEAELSRPVAQVLSWRWVGTDCGTPVFDGRRVSLAATAAAGLLEVTYRAYADRWRVSAGLAYTALLVASLGETTASLQIEPEEEDEGGDDEDGGENTEYTIVVVDYCTGDPVEGAVVSLSGVVAGTTDESGQVSVTLVAGRSYSVRVTAAGYDPSDADTLANDSFTAQAGGGSGQSGGNQPAGT